MSGTSPGAGLELEPRCLTIEGRYVARPPLSQERLTLAPDRRRLAYSFKRPWRDGSHAVLLDPLDLIARLAAMIPPPRFHMLRYHGVLAAHAKVRSEVVPGPAPEPTEPLGLRLVFDGETVEPELATKRSSRHPARAEESLSLLVGVVAAI